MSNRMAHKQPSLPDHHVFHGPIAGKTIVAGDTLAWMRAEAADLGNRVDESWKVLVAEEEERIWRHLEKN